MLADAAEIGRERNLTDLKKNRRRKKKWIPALLRTLAALVLLAAGALYFLPAPRLPAPLVPASEALRGAVDRIGGRLNPQPSAPIETYPVVWVIDGDTLLFFTGHAAALPLYARLEEKIGEMFPEAGKRVQKTQITFFHRHVFACVSFARVLRRSGQPEGSLVLTLGLPAPLHSARVAVQTEPYPGRWTCHLVLRSAEEVDGEILARLREAYAFSERK